MKNFWLAGISSVAILAAGSANAADLPPSAYKAPVAAAVPWSWTGFYLGAHLGSGWASDSWTDPFSGKSLANGTLPGFLGGFQAGYNYQIDRLVIGIQGDFSFSGVKGTLGGFECEEFAVCNVKKDWFSTVTGRVGGTVDHALLYVKGGAAWVHDSISLSQAFVTTPAVPSSSLSTTRTGWTWGAGVEYAFTPNWSGMIEYDFMDFGTNGYTSPLIETERCVTVSCAFNSRQVVNVVKAGVNYKFDSMSWH